MPMQAITKIRSKSFIALIILALFLIGMGQSWAVTQIPRKPIILAKGQYYVPPPIKTKQCLDNKSQCTCTCMPINCA